LVVEVVGVRVRPQVVGHQAQTYVGDTVVETEDFTDVNTAANLKKSDF
jgi:hypothetical protein